MQQICMAQIYTYVFFKETFVWERNVIIPLPTQNFWSQIFFLTINFNPIINVCLCSHHIVVQIQPIKSKCFSTAQTLDASSIILSAFSRYFSSMCVCVCVCGVWGVLFQVPQRREIQSGRGSLSNRSVNTRAYQMLKRRAAVEIHRGRIF